VNETLTNYVGTDMSTRLEVGRQCLASIMLYNYCAGCNIWKSWYR